MVQKQVDLKIGFDCNNNCVFCAQAHNRRKGNLAKRKILKILNQNKDSYSQITFTGGEPTIRKDIIEIIYKAKNMGYKKIQIQSNGRMFSSLPFLKQLIDAGATEFCPALHGYCSKQHDFLTKAPGSFEQTVKGIQNIKQLGHKIITNTVIVKPNYRNIPKIVQLLIMLKVDQFQLAFVHPIGNAMKNFESIVPTITLAAPYIKQGLSIGSKAGIPCMAEAMPYCLMHGFESHISENYIPKTKIINQDQVITDYTIIRKGYDKTKFKKCLTCKYDPICEGPWKEYPKKRGNAEFKPILRS